MMDKSETLMPAPANADIGTTLYRIMRSLEHCDGDQLAKVLAFIAQQFVPHDAAKIDCPHCGTITNAPEGSYICPIYWGTSFPAHCPIFMDGQTRAEFQEMFEKYTNQK